MKARILLGMAALVASSTASAKPPTVTLALGGDVMFGRMTSDGWREHAAPELDRWRQTLRDADVALVNLETSICEQGDTSGPLPLLWAPPRVLDRLIDAGVDAVNIANNHAYDCGPQSVRGTVQALRDRHIGVAGLGSPLILREDVVVVGASMVRAPFRRDGQAVAAPVEATNLIADVTAARAAHPDQLLVVSLHWGLERSTEPAAWQRRLARSLINAGANVIAGHGPHTAQPTERINGGVVLYSLGNLVFDDRSPLGEPRPPKVLTFQRTAGAWVLDSASREAL